MKKFSIMFFLILVVALFACKQEEAGEKAEGTATTKTPQELADEAKKAEEEKKKKDEEAAAKKAREDALTALKDKIAEINKKMTGEKAAHDTLGTTGQKKVEIPTGVTEIRVKDTDLPKVYASLNYDQDLIDKLNTAIKVLDIKSTNKSSKTTEIETVNKVLETLIGIDDTTTKILGTHLKDDKLPKIENDKAKIETATKELKEFIDSRDKFIKSAEAIIKDASSKTSSSDVKTALNKITGAASGTTDPKTGEAGYGAAMVKAIEANATALENLVK
ncbi:hypothetical protein [Borrelia sp. RT5S]|uniref:hypothetical protein n=1 Tax=Borrelia sp. RT5S TaxID=2898581 RepID=UPI001E2E65C2|nr:hypothetical protein [Borrelia sp. RT5S]UGQ16809.1 hypothetical protein LSO06_05660 [Borrelia sp. RT5S]